MKSLIINVDDFGYSEIFNESILDLIRNDFVSSTTVMVNRASSQMSHVSELINLKKSKGISVGVHLEFMSQNYYDEIEQQVEMFMEMFDFFPTHFDIHKPCGSEAERMAVEKFCLENNMPCRKFNSTLGNVRTTTNMVINGSQIELDDFNELLEEMDDNNSYEILFGCDEVVEGGNRESDIEKIKYIHSTLEIFGVRLINFNNL